MNFARPMRGLLLVLAVSLAFAPAAQAITDEEIFRQMQFNFINPGARALGLGGSFIAVADDATAAQANPAGLMQLAAPEFFVEERFIGGDKSSGEDSVSGIFQFSSSNERRAVTTPTFFSYVKPWKTFALGFSRQELMNTRVKVESALDFTFFGATTWFGEGDAAVNVTNWNVSAAWQPIEWLSIGGTASFGQFHMDGRVNNFISDPNGLFLCAPSGPFDCSAGTNPALANPQNWYQTAIDDEDNDVTFSLGVLIKPMDQFSVGLVYRQGADYEFEQEVTDGLSSFIPGTPLLSRPSTTFTHEMNLPDSFGLGLKWRPGENWTVAADVVRVTYSDLLDGLVNQINILTQVGFAAGFPSDFTIDDVTEIHAGAEYLFTETKWPLSVRGGVFYDPDNVLRDTTGNYGDALAGRDNELHYNVGAGIVIQQKFQADVAVSISEIGNEGLASFIFRF